MVLMVVTWGPMESRGRGCKASEGCSVAKGAYLCSVMQY